MHERIDGIDDALLQRPGDARLYLMRGDPHRQHRDWRAALADFAEAKRLAPGLAMTDYLIGVTRLEAGEPGAAKAALDRFLAFRPDSSKGYLQRARALAAMDRPLAAADDFDLVIVKRVVPSPDLYHERARLLAGLGPAQAERLLRGLDEGIGRLGPIVSLVTLAVDVEVARGRHDLGLVRIGRLPEKIRSLPRWLARKGDILRAGGRRAEAREAYEAALRRLRGLRPPRRATRAARDLESRITQALEALGAPR